MSIRATIGRPPIVDGGHQLPQDPTADSAPYGAPISRRRKAAYAAIVLLVGLAAIEGLARAFVDPPSVLLQAPTSGNVNLDIPTFFDSNSNRFWQLKPNVDRAPEFWGDVTDSHGFRQSPTTTVHNAIVCLGDSCTYGLGLPESHSWPSVLRRSGVGPVVNAGVPGYTSYQGLRYWHRELKSLSTRALVVEFGVNDANPWPSQHGSGLVCLTDRARARQVRFRTLMDRSRALSALVALMAPLPDPAQHAFDERDWSTATPRVPIGEFVANLNEFAEADIPVLFLAWPRRVLVDPSFENPVPSDRSREREYFEAVLELEQAGYPVLDVASEFAATGRTLDDLYLDDVHATKLASAVIADAVARVLRPLLGEEREK